MKITRHFIFEGQSIFGGWSRVQIECLGIAWPLRSGWINDACGKEVLERAHEFLNLTNAQIDPWDMEQRRCKQHLRAITHD
jgi:hypothetical protein